MRRELVRILAAVYEPAPSEAEWLARVRDAIAPLFDHGLGVRAETFSDGGREVPPFEIVDDEANTIAVLRAFDGDSSGCAFIVPLRRRPRAARRLASRWAAIQGHISAGRRLVRTRDRLRTEAVAAEQISPVETGATIVMWRALVDGEWSLVDAFDRDGKRFVVARKNDTDVATHRSLTTREREIVTCAALGQSNKTIANELGISTSAVSVYLATALRKMGARTRRDLFALIPASEVAMATTRKFSHT